MTVVLIIIAVMLSLLVGYFVIFKQGVKPQANQESVKYEDVLTAAIADSARMIAYASKRGVSLDPKEVEAILTAQRLGAKITEAQEAVFWTSTSSIAKAISPVTIESLEATSSPAAGRSSLAEQAARKYRIRTIVTLIALLIFQIYWLVGATIVSDLKDIRSRLEKLQMESYEGQIAMAALDANDKDYESKKKKLDLTASNWNDRLWLERISAWADFRVLKTWNVGKGLFFGGEQTIPVQEATGPSGPQIDGIKPVEASNDVKQSDFFLWSFTGENAEQMQTAQIIMTALLKYILPILYGALGASAYIVRSLANEIKDFTYIAGSKMRYELRFYLGAVAGLSIAWFTSETKSAETSGIVQSLSPLALAFLAGYSVELLFSLLDRLVTAFSGPEPKQRP
jgi:hypothetical protein